MDFGSDAQWGMSKFNPIRRRWFDRWLKDEDNGVDNDPPILLFVMGGGDGKKNADGRINHGGYWREEQEWPLARSQSTKFYLHANGHLTTDAPESSEASITYTFDPENPVPTLGGNVASFSVIDKPEEGGPTFTEAPPPGEQADTILQHSWWLVTAGPMHQREQPGLMACSEPYPLLCDRPDVIAFQTEPLVADVEITGPIEVNLWVSSSAPDTDFTAKLLDIYPPSEDYPDGLSSKPLRLRHPLPLPKLVDRARDDDTRRGLSGNHRANPHEQPFQIRSSHPRRHLQQQLPAPRHQPKHRRADGTTHVHTGRTEHHPPQSQLPLSHLAANRSVIEPLSSANPSIALQDQAVKRIAKPICPRL